ncbi:alpha/beta fold hydrolase [Actinoallomurus acaciae]|uniref:Alpha/beta fold hydrolase n=1 Tax=Actinoallomurus acaciae TaxID=502577 RepID=A0ABV5YMG3_9ACTN
MPHRTHRSQAALTTGQHVIEVDGVCQAYEVAGNGPVCLVHSGGPGIDSGYLRMPLLERHMTMVYLDPVGTGQSDFAPGGDYSVPAYARFSEGVLKHLDVDRPFFIGHSHGGFVGLEVALRNPGLLGGLVAYSTAPLYGPALFEEATRQMDAFAARWPDRPEAAEAARAWDAAMVSRTATITDRRSHREFLRAILPACFADFRRTVADRGPITLEVTYDPARENGEWDGRGLIDRIGTPTLVVSGACDFVCPRPWSEELVARIPAARMLALDHSGHFGHLESEQDTFVREVVAFVTG